MGSVGEGESMLTLIESAMEKVHAQGALQARLEKSWRNREKRVVVWRPDSRQITVHHNGRYWFGSLPLNDDGSTPRYWNPFGEYRASGNLQIAVELNVPTDSNSKRVSGFFAKDAETGVVYLMHDGGVGGGRKGVGQKAFLAWSDSKLVPVADAEGDFRLGIIVAPVDAKDTASDIARFVQSTIEFKDAVKRGEAHTPQARAAQRRFDDYFDEFSGKKRRRRVKEMEYISRHGDIVRALRKWRQQTLKADEKFVKDAYVDLGVQSRDTLREIYEVKSSCERQALYTAIGQIVVHDDSPRGGCKRFLVLPDDETIPGDVTRALTRSGISLVRFALQGDRVRVLKAT
jgi:hypothetical protein